ncbi:MAG: C2 family cysteine protease [Methanoregulaceae archaeon]|nr:C2 family cysteine protease [Methanoregulaceae archaeon]
MAEKEIRSNIGARSPYAIVEAIEKKAIPWKKKSKKETRSLLKQVLGMPYDELFDPSLDSPLYRGLEGRSDEDDLQSIKSMSSPCGIAPTGWNLDPDWRFSIAGIPAGTDWEDPVQGCSLDCYLIAALSSVRFSRPARINLDNRPDSTYSITFHDEGIPTVFSGANDLPVNGSDLVYGRSRTANEIWPAVYEKAYAKFLCSKNPPGCPLCPSDANGDHPTISGFNGGTPYAALQHISGLYFADGVTSFATTALPADNGSELLDPPRYTSIYAKIFRKCGNNPEGATSAPMVATTYYSEAENPDGLPYSEETIVANHSYSVLGVHTEDVNGVPTKFVVLRNPYGQLWGADPAYSGTPLALARGNWLGRPLCIEDGIFGLKVHQFKRYFERFGWVQNPP